MQQLTHIGPDANGEPLLASGAGAIFRAVPRPRAAISPGSDDAHASPARSVRAMTAAAVTVDPVR